MIKVAFFLDTTQRKLGNRVLIRGFLVEKITYDLQKAFLNSIIPIFLNFTSLVRNGR